MNTMYNFPKDFLWGAATSAYQVEGNNINCDWWEWEKRTGVKEPSGEACRSYGLYREDFGLAKELHHNAHRLSIEWSRIEPREGEFIRKEIEHYRDVILTLRERGIEPVVTLHHFTNPLWFARKGGWVKRGAQEYFLRFVKEITGALCDQVKFWITINEPMVYVYHSYILGVWPPQEKSLFLARKAEDNLLASHLKAYKLIHGLYREKNLPEPFVGFAQNWQEFVPCSRTLRNKFAVSLRDRFYNHDFIRKTAARKTLDFIGINYYSPTVVEVRGFGLKNLILDTCESNHLGLKKNSLGWLIYPQGLYNLLIRLKRYNLPVFITENGICTDDDSLRWEYIAEHLKNLNLAMGKGVRVIGYLYWSLIDNFEWDKGFRPRFGLIDVDYNTYKRTIRDSAWKFAEVCKTGVLNL